MANENYVDLEREAVYDRHGRRITPEYMDRALDDVDDDAAPVEPTRVEYLRGRGRPSLSGPRTHSPRVSFRVPPELHNRIKLLAAGQHRREADVLRDAVEEYAARHSEAAGHS